jgi:hypothetical protein
MNGFLSAAAQAERQQLADLLLVIAIGGQGYKDAIQRLQRQLDHEN